MTEGVYIFAVTFFLKKKITWACYVWLYCIHWVKYIFIQHRSQWLLPGWTQGLLHKFKLIFYLQSVIVIWSCTGFFFLFFFVHEIKTFMMVSNSITNDNQSVDEVYPYTHTCSKMFARSNFWAKKKFFVEKISQNKRGSPFTAGDIALPVLKQQKRTRTLHDAFVIRNV